jgi:hypothetical protein
MFCHLSHIIEDCYFDEIELFFLVVGHTHNILDQWFGVFARAIRKADFIGSVMALHALYKIAHSSKVHHLRPKLVHQLEIYHDWVKFYAPVLNEDIKHFGIPLRWKFTRDPFYGVAKCQYLVFSPTAGLMHLEKWQPVESHLPDTPHNGSVELSLFMMFNGPETLYNAIGIDTSSNSTSTELLNSMAMNEKECDKIGDAASVLPVIRDIEVRAIGETRVRMAKEAENGQSPETVHLPPQMLKTIYHEIKRNNSSQGGRMVWLKRTKISDDPLLLSRRPDILPNPRLWTDLITTDEAKKKAFEELNGQLSTTAASKEKSDPEVALAKQRIIQFNKGAIEIATTASQILKMVPTQITVTDDTYNIATATSNFKKPVLTRQEFNWYSRLNSANAILKRQEAIVAAELLKPWQLLNIPDETPEQKSGAWICCKRVKCLLSRSKLDCDEFLCAQEKANTILIFRL